MTTASPITQVVRAGKELEHERRGGGYRTRERQLAGEAVQRAQGKLGTGMELHQ